MPNANDPTVHVRRDKRPQGVIAYLTIDDGRGLNVMSSAVMDALAEALLALASDEDLRVVVLSGAGAKAFSAGADIKEMAAIENPEEAKALIMRLHRSCDTIRNLPVPVIAGIHGFCFGAGLEIAAACDVRLACEAASFGMPEVKIGIPSVIEAALFPLLTGWAARAKSCCSAKLSLRARRWLGDWSSTSCRRQTSTRRSKLGSVSS